MENSITNLPKVIIMDHCELNSLPKRISDLRNLLPKDLLLPNEFLSSIYFSLDVTFYIVSFLALWKKESFWILPFLWILSGLNILGLYQFGHDAPFVFFVSSLGTMGFDFYRGLGFVIKILLIPFVIANYFIGVTVYTHHIQPAIPFYKLPQAIDVLIKETKQEIYYRKSLLFDYFDSI